MRHTIALLTDFGVDSYYVGQMKGAILQGTAESSHDLNLVDITHSISPQNIVEAGQVLADSFDAFPSNTLFLIVVDPGVGTQRKIVLVEVNDRTIVCPDNGLLTKLLHRYSNYEAFVASEIPDSNPSKTFHGRDIMAPLISKLASGYSASELGAPLQSLLTVDLPTLHSSKEEIQGEIVLVDSFGNCITNIPGDLFSGSTQNLNIQVGGETLSGFAETYGNSSPGTPLALFGSNGHLEIAVCNGNAATELGLKVGDQVKIQFD